MELSNLSLSSPAIAAFFKTGNKPPVRELLFVHQHPLLKPNFVTDLERLVLQAAETISVADVTDPVTRQRSDTLISCIATIANALPSLDQDRAVEALRAMRAAHDVCQSILTGKP